MKMPTLLICNTNTLENTDYGIPITVHKSTDYRTSTGTHHRLIPSQPQDFDCSIRTRLRKEEISSKNAAHASRDYDTTYSTNYYFKQADSNAGEFKPRPWNCAQVYYAQGAQEKRSQSRARPINLYMSETKASYPRVYIPFNRREVFPPEPYALCEICALGRDEQPPIRPEEKGYYKLLDPYLTTSRASYIPYSQNVQDGLSRKDITTFWSATDMPRAGQGYGPKNPDKVEPLVVSHKPLYPDRVMRIRPKLLPNYGMQSEYQGGYIKQTYSDLHPYLRENGVIFDDPLARASPWQNLVPPGMYCSEQCHIGTGWRVDAVVEQRDPASNKRGRVLPADDPCWTGEMQQ